MYSIEAMPDLQPDSAEAILGHESDESRGKFIQVESWDLHSTEDLQNHYKNEGLLRAIQQIAV